MTILTQEEFTREVSHAANLIVKDRLRREKMNNNCGDGITVYSFEPDVYVFVNDFTLTKRDKEEEKACKTKKQKKNKFKFFSRRRISVEK